MCPHGYFKDEEDHICYPCHEQCETCTQNATFCQTCTSEGPSESFLYSLDQSCLSQCPDGYYEDSVDHTCKQCDSKCAQCEINATYCQSCTLTAPFEAFLLGTDSSCLTTCPEGYFKNFSNHHCEACHEKCATCTANATFCQSCTVTGAAEAFLYSANSSCMTICPDGYFNNAGTHVCGLCGIGCTLCSGSADNCQECDESLGYGLTDSRCVSLCPDGTYMNNGKCEFCSAFCTLCVSSPSDCRQCQSSGAFESYYLEANFSCLHTCPDGFYANDSDHVCYACDPKCSLCDATADSCQMCMGSGDFESFLFAENSSCLAVCPDGYYSNSTDHSCYACDEKCTLCTGNATFCLECVAESGAYEAFLLEANQSCLSDCPDTFFENSTDHKCYSCDNNCAQCDLTPSNCQSCKSSGSYESFFFADNSSCLAVCPDGFYKNTSDHSCYPCDEQCQQCAGTSSFCQVCTASGPSESFLLQSNSSCLHSCPASYFADPADHVCHPCDAKCLSCETNSTHCQFCVDGGANEAFLFASNSSCLSVCPDGFYSNSTNHHCQACDEKCALCSINDSFCQVCVGSGIH